MRIKRAQVALIMTLLIGLTFQSFMLPACGADSFKLRIESKLSEVVLSWTPVAGATSYDIYRSLSNTSKLATVAADTSKYRDRSVTRGKSYTYWIIAKKDDTQLATSNSWVAVAGNKQSSPSAPTLRAKAFSTPYVELSWGGSGNAVYYELEQKTGNYDFHTRATLNKETKYNDFFVSRGATYTYRVKSFNEYGDSDYSNQVTVSVKPTGAAPDVPAGFAARNDRFYNSDTKKYEDNKQVELSWSYDDNDAQEFIIEKKKSLEGDYTKIIAIPGFNLFTNRKGGAYSYDSSASSKHYFYFDTNVSTDSTYYYRIKAYNNNGESAYSRETRVDTLITKRPSPPSDLKAEAAPGRVTLTWRNNSANEKGLRIERRAEGTQSFSEIGSLGAGVSSYSDTSFLPNTINYYRIRAFNDKGASDYSEEAKVTALSAPPQITPKAEKGINKFDSVYILLLYSSPNASSASGIKFLTIPPVIKSTTTLLPAVDIANLLNAAIEWDDTEKKATITCQNQTIEAWAQKNTARINGSLIAVDTNDPTITPIIEEQKYLMLPLQLIEKGFKCKIDWQPDDKFIKVFISK